MSISPALYTFESIQKLLVTFRSSVSVSLTSLISSLLPSSGFILKMASLTSNLLTRFPFGSSPLNILTLWWVRKETKNKQKSSLVMFCFKSFTLLWLNFVCWTSQADKVLRSFCSSLDCFWSIVRPNFCSQFDSKGHTLN